MTEEITATCSQACQDESLTSLSETYSAGLLTAELHPRSLAAVSPQASKEPSLVCSTESLSRRNELVGVSPR